jgi:hypothetical protein
MTGTKKRSVYRKSRKHCGFSGVRKQERKLPESSSTISEDVGHVVNVNTSQLPNNDESASGSGELSTPRSASRSKLSQHKAQECAENEGIAIRPSQYRLIDIGQLSSALSDIHRCEQGRHCDLLLLLIVIEFISNLYRFLYCR